MNTRLLKHKNKNFNFALKTFLLAIGTACIIFIPYIILNGGIFYYFGDFNVQEIPFYQLIHDAVREGTMGWSHTTDLGSDTISSYSFYLLGSPFFWLTIPFPSEAVPYLIGPLLILKFGCASLSAYIYLKRYVRNKNYAVIGGLLYSLSGFSIYNVFFFHFHEPMIVFPLLLAALDSFLYDKKRFVFGITVFVACVVNYYFFTGQVVFVIIYFLLLMLTKTCKFSIKEFLILAVETLIGFFAAAFILLPSVLGILGNPRLDTLPNGWESLTYENPQKYFLIIISFFFPADTPAFPVFTPNSNCKWASVAGFIPLFGMVGVIAFLQSNKKSFLKLILIILTIFAFVPVLNSLFQMLNSSIYYARWYYMIVLMMVLATLKALEDKEANWNKAIFLTTTITCSIIALIGFMPLITDNDDGSQTTTIGVAHDKIRFWIYALMALACLLAFVLIYKKYSNNSFKYANKLIFGVITFSIISSLFIVGYGVMSSSTTEPIKKNIINNRDAITISDIDDDNVRCDFYECVDNTQMFWKLQSINCFQSSVSPSIMEFYDSISVTRDVASRPPVEKYGIRSYLSCKYLFDYKSDGKRGDDNSFLEKDGTTKMPMFKKIKSENGFDIYENECYIPMGFTYDSFITKEEYKRVTSMHSSEACVYSMILSKEQMKKYSLITGYTDKKYSLLYSKKSNKFVSAVDNYSFSQNEFKEECSKRSQNSCSEFNYTNDGFTAVFNNTGKENLLFFSIPYSDGFKATVNGKNVEIEKVNNGFMAVKVPANQKCNIKFTYNTPGLSLGIKISLMSLLSLIIYIGITLIYRYRKKRHINA